MDDPQNHHTLDALADLFLTGTAPATPGPARRPSDPLSGPAPIRLPPKTRRDDTLPNAVPSVPFRTGPSAPSTLKPQASSLKPATEGVIGTIGIEHPTGESPRQQQQRYHARAQGVILGSLPGFAGPWLVQYAHHLAQAQGPVVLLRIDDQQIDVQLITPQSLQTPSLPGTSGPDSSSSSSSSSSSLKPQASGLNEPSSPVEAIDRAVHDPAGPSHRVLVHLTGQAGGTSLRLDDWTILCGAYDAALADAVHQAHELLSRSGEAGKSMRLGVMFMGSDADRAKAAARRLASVLSSDLKIPLALAGHQKQMTPVRIQTLGSFPLSNEHWSDLRAYLEELAQQTVEDLSAGVSAVATKPQAADPLAVPSDADDLAHDADADLLKRSILAQALSHAGIETETDYHPSAPPPSPSPSAPSLTEASGPDISSSSSSTLQTPTLNPSSSASPTPDTRHPTPALSSPPDLASFATSHPGLVALQARSPRHKETQIAVDQEGHLHLLVQHHASPAARRDHAIMGAELRSCVVSLLETRAWVKEHFELLAMTQRQIRLAPGCDLTLHLFTDQSKLAAHLAATLGESVKLHLLQQVHLAGQTTWVGNELN